MKEIKSYTLEECLNNESKERIDELYDTYQIFMPSNEKNKKTYLKEAIPLFFEDLFEFIELDRGVIEASEKGFTKMNTPLDTIFFEVQDGIYILPSELIDIYKERTKKNSNYQREKLLKAVEQYLLIYGIFPLTLLDNIMKEFAIKVDKQTVKSIIKKSDIIIYKGEYISRIKDSKEIENILQEKEISSYKELSYYEVTSYYYFIKSFFERLSNILKKPADELEEIVLNDNTDRLNPEDYLTALESKITIPEKKKKKVLKFFEEEEFEIRYWKLKGRTLREYDEELMVDDCLLKSIPKKRDIMSILKCASPSLIENLCGTFMIKPNSSLSEIRDNILNYIEEWNYGVDDELREEMLDYHQKEYLYDLDKFSYLTGVIFLYKEVDKVKVFVPKETEEMLENPPLDNDFTIDVDDIDDRRAILCSYIIMNGIIKIDTLQKLLKEYHNKDITREEIHMLLDEDYDIIDDEYYTFNLDFFNSLDKKERTDIKDITAYKKFEENVLEKELEFLQELGNLVNEFKCDDKDGVLFSIYALAKDGILGFASTEEVIKKYTTLPINRNEQKKLIELLDEYKDKLSIWSLCGHTTKEIKDSGIFISNFMKG